MTATVGTASGRRQRRERRPQLGIENLRGGTAGDVLTGDAGANTLDGFSGNNDSLTGGNVNGGADPDGADTFIGGAGTGDTVNYTLRTGAVGVTLDGTANDGDIATSENDNVGSDGTVENVNGGGGSDTLRGQATSVVNVLTGNGGADTLDGGLGNDTLNGNAGNDTYDAKSAAEGSDTFNGGADTDTADYSARSAALDVSLDGAANDGDSAGGGEDDNIATDVENVKGGSQATS